MTQGLNRKLTLSDVSTHTQTAALEAQILDGRTAPAKEAAEPVKDQPIKEKSEASEKGSAEEETPHDENHADSEPKAPETDAADNEDKKVSSEKDEDDDEDDEESDSKPTEAEKQKRKSRNQKRIERLSKLNATLNGQLSQALQAIREAQQAPTAQAKPQNDPTKPSRADFDDPDAYDEALIEWSANTTKKKLEDSEQNKVREAQTQQVREAWQLKIESGNDKYDDFDEVVLNDALPISMPMAQAIISLENGDDVAYHLGKNLDVAKKIASLDGVQAGIELSKIAAKLENSGKENEEKARVKAEEEKAKRKISKAPEPHKPASSKRSSDVIDLDNETPEQYKIRRLKEMKYSSLKPILKLR